MIMSFYMKVYVSLFLMLLLISICLLMVTSSSYRCRHSARISKYIARNMHALILLIRVGLFFRPGFRGFDCGKKSNYFTLSASTPTSMLCYGPPFSIILQRSKQSDNESYVASFSQYFQPMQMKQIINSHFIIFTKQLDNT